MSEVKEQHRSPLGAGSERYSTVSKPHHDTVRVHISAILTDRLFTKINKNSSSQF